MLPIRSTAPATCALLLLLPLRAAGQGEPAHLPVPAEWETFYAWFLVPNPSYAAGSADEEAALQQAHIQYQLRLQERGVAVTAGGFGQGEGPDAAGMTILRAASLDAAREIAAGDPAVRAGNLLARVREWWVPTGGLPDAAPTTTSARRDATGEVRRFVEAHRLATERRDARALRPMYAPAERFTWYEDGAPRYTSVDEVLAGLAAFPPEMPLRTTYAGVTVEPLGADAARAAMRFETTAGAGPDAFSFDGVMTMVLERTAEGWRIVSGHTSTGGAGAGPGREGGSRPR